MISNIPLHQARKFVKKTLQPKGQKRSTIQVYGTAGSAGAAGILYGNQMFIKTQDLDKVENPDEIHPEVQKYLDENPRKVCNTD